MRHPVRTLLLGLLVVAGCGKVDKFVDAGDDDAPVDSMTLDAPEMGTVNIVAVDRPILTATAAPGVLVFVTGRDGTPGARATTDTDGHATVAVSAGDFVTTMYPRNSFDQFIVTTFANVAPGDTLTVGNRPQNDFTPIGTGMAVSWTAVAGADYYYVYAPCANGTYTQSTTFTLNTYSWCTQTTFDVVVVAHNATTGTFTMSSHAAAVAWLDGGPIPMPAFTAVVSMTTSVSGLPASVSDTNLTGFPYYGAVNAQTFYGGGPPAAGTITATGNVPAGANGLRTQYTLYRNAFGPQLGFEFATITGTSHTITNPSLLPWIGDAIANAATRQLTWIADSSGADPADLLTIELYWHHDTPAFAYAFFGWSPLQPILGRLPSGNEDLEHAQGTKDRNP